MNPILKNIFAILLGAVIGSVVNMSFILVSGSVIPPPEGAAYMPMAYFAGKLVAQKDTL